MEIREHVALAPHTTLRVGGSARYFVEAYAAADVAEACAFAHDKTGQPPLLLGGGSNVLFSDGEAERLVLKISIPGIDIRAEGEQVLLTAGGGEDWETVVAYSIEQGLSGLENLSGIPGTTGATPVQNINAYGVSLADTLDSVTVYDQHTGAMKQLSAAECQLGYRDSIFKHAAGSRFVVTSVTFRLSPESYASALAYRSSAQSIAALIAENGDEPSPTTVRKAVLQARRNIGMLEGQYRSAGSFFKNTILARSDFNALHARITHSYTAQHERFAPWFWELPNGDVKVSTAFLLECTAYNKSTYGTKRDNGVGFSPQHSLSVVTEPGATAADVRAFAAKVMQAVSENLDVKLEREVIYM